MQNNNYLSVDSFCFWVFNQKSIQKNEQTGI